jgi:hypothetical protein
MVILGMFFFQKNLSERTYSEQNQFSFFSSALIRKKQQQLI